MNSKVFMSEDLLFILEYSIYAKRFGAIEENLYYYNRLNEKSISSNVNISYLENYKILIDNMQKLLIELNMQQELIDNTVVSKVQSLVNRILIGESNNYLKKRDKGQFINNVKLVTENSFINGYIYILKDNNKIDKIQNKYLKSKKYNKLLYFNVIIIFIKSLKDKILRRA